MAGPRLYIPNGGHPLNVGKVAWFLALPRSGGAFYDLLSGLVAVPRGAPAYSGQQRDGSLGAALAPGTAATGWVGQSVPLLNNLPTLGAGFSLAFWLNPLGIATATTLMLSKGNGNTGGWDFGTATGQLRFRASRATTDDSFLSTSATLLPAYAWRRLLVTGKLGGPYTVYVNGRSQAGTTTAGSGNYSGDTTQNLTLCNVVGLTNGQALLYDDFNFWNRKLQAAEAWADFQESSAGYPGALLNGPLTVRTSVAAAAVGALALRRGRKAWKREPVFDFWRRGAP